MLKANPKLIAKVSNTRSMLAQNFVCSDQAPNCKPSPFKSRKTIHKAQPFFDDLSGLMLATTTHRTKSAFGGSSFYDS